MSPTVLSETKTEFGRESYDQNGENGKLAIRTEGWCLCAIMTRDNAIWALSQGNVAATQRGMREWHATLPFWQCRGHSRPQSQIRVFNLISFLISHSNISQLFSLGFSRFWAILETQVLISKGFSESITTLTTIVEGVIFFSFTKLHHHCWWVSHFLGFCSNPSD